MKKALMGLVAGIALGWLGHSYIAKPEIVVKEKVVVQEKIVERQVYVRRSAEVKQPKDSEIIVLECEKPVKKDVEEVLLEDIAGKKCIGITGFEDAARELGNIYASQGFEAARELYLSLKDLTRNVVCDWDITPDELNRLLLKQLSPDDVWKLLTEEHHNGETYDVIMSNSEIEEMVSYLKNASDREEKIKDLCHDKQDVFRKAYPYGGVAGSKSNYAIGESSPLCRHLAKEFPDDLYESTEWIEEVPELAIAYEFRKSYQESEETFGWNLSLFNPPEEGERAPRPEEKEFINKAAGIICINRKQNPDVPFQSVVDLIVHNIELISGIDLSFQFGFLIYSKASHICGDKE
ncbi:hypothetical protein GOV03_03085 [Candidatus Woesearchaeota archaeon]|nr:hypothetical protein [Candidatus Woesearchaeota archaeon]